MTFISIVLTRAAGHFKKSAIQKQVLALDTPTVLLSITIRCTSSEVTTVIIATTCTDSTFSSVNGSKYDETVCGPKVGTEHQRLFWANVCTFSEAMMVPDSSMTFSFSILLPSNGH